MEEKRSSWYQVELFGSEEIIVRSCWLFLPTCIYILLFKRNMEMAVNSTINPLSFLHTLSQYNSSNFTFSNTTLSPNDTSGGVRPRRPPIPMGPDFRIIIFIYVLNGMFVLVGVLGNLFVCYVISKGRRMYTVANLFLMNLAVADTCILTISYSLWIMMSPAIMKWPLGGIMCKILPSLSDAFYGVSLGSITTISIYRYRMILYPLHTHMTFFQAKVTILIIWIVSLLSISAPLYPVIQYNPKRQLCGSRWPDPLYLQVYQWVMLIIWYVIPLAIILYTYIRIRGHLRNEMKYKWMKNHSNGKANGVNGCDNAQQAISGHVAGIKRALKLLAPVVVVFTLFMFPWNLGRLLSVVTDVRKLKGILVLEFLGATLLFANSAVNAFIYYFMSREFREEFRQRFRVARKFFRLGKAGHFAVHRNYSMSFRTRIELLSVARSGTRRCIEVSERLTVV